MPHAWQPREALEVCARGRDQRQGHRVPHAGRCIPTFRPQSGAVFLAPFGGFSGAHPRQWTVHSGVGRGGICPAVAGQRGMGHAVFF